MDVGKMQAQIVELTNSLFQEGFVDDQFTQLQQLQDESNPDFVSEVVGLYFEDSERLLDVLAKTLGHEPVDFKMVDAHVHQFKGSSSSIGVQRVKNICVTLRSLCELQDLEGCRQALQQVKQEYFMVKNKLANLFELEQQVLQAGGTVPMLE